MKYEWNERRHSAYYNEQQTGKIIGTVTRISISDNTWISRVNGDYLGEYLSELQAKKATEKKIKEIDAETLELRKTHPKFGIRKAQEK